MMNFGVPNLKPVKQEKYNEPVITLVAIEKEGQSRKFELNKHAQEVLKLTKTDLAPATEGGEVIKGELAFSFDDQGRILIVNTTGYNVGAALTYKPSTKSLSDKRTYDYVRRLMNTPEEQILELFLHQTPNSFNGNTVYELKKISNVDQNLAPVETMEDHLTEEVIVEEEQPIVSEQAVEYVAEETVNEVVNETPEVTEEVAGMEVGMEVENAPEMEAEAPTLDPLSLGDTIKEEAPAAVPSSNPFI